MESHPGKNPHVNYVLTLLGGGCGDPGAQQKEEAWLGISTQSGSMEVQSISHHSNIQNINVHPEGQELCSQTGSPQQVRTRSLDG